MKTIDKEVIELVQPYIEGLELGKTFHKKNTGQLQVGYYISKLTTAYAKVNDWEQVIYWSELFFSLPKNYRDRSSNTEQEKIMKRIDRAKKQLETVNTIAIP